MTTIEQAEYVIDELSKSTNQAHAQERSEIVLKLQISKDIVQGNFRSVVPEPLNAGETRYYVAPRELADFMVELHRGDTLINHAASLVLCMDGRFCVTIVAKEEHVI